MFANTLASTAKRPTTAHGTITNAIFGHFALISSRIRKSSLLGLLPLVLCSCSVGRLETSASPPSNNACANTAAGQFVTAIGSRLCRGGHEVRLRGINFNNENALGGTVGSGMLADVNIAEPDYARVADWGMNHVRLGLSYGWYAADSSAFFRYLDQQISWAGAHKILVTPLLFTTPGDCYEGYGKSCGIWTSDTERLALEHFWVAIATHYHDNPAIAGYDLLNEPTPPGANDSLWFNLATTIRDAIRAVDPNHLVIIEAGSGGTFASTLGAGVVYSVHDYYPSILTLKGGYKYPGYAPDGAVLRYWDKGVLGSLLATQLSVSFAAEHQVPLYIGEFGALPKTTGYVQLDADKIDLMDSWGVNWCFFVYREGSADDFGIYTGPASLHVGDPGVATKEDLVSLLRTKLKG